MTKTRIFFRRLLTKVRRLFRSRHRSQKVRQVEDLMDQMIDEGADRIIGNPGDLDSLISEGLSIRKRKTKSKKTVIRDLYRDRKRGALERTAYLPPISGLGVPSIESLYLEIWECVAFRLYGSAITLSGILVEYALKYATYVKERGGHANYDPVEWDGFEKIAMAGAISRAKKAGLLDDTEESQLVSFKNTVRNPYNHYNIRKITEEVRATVKLANFETFEIEEKEIAAKDDPVMQSQAKPFC